MPVIASYSIIQMEEKVNIPENIQQVCRDFAEVAIKHGLFNFSGKFQPPHGWSGEISFNWKAGRHSEDQNEISISSQMWVNTNVRMQKS